MLKKRLFIVSSFAMMVIALFALVSYHPQESRHLAALERNLETPQYEVSNEADTEDYSEIPSEAEEDDENNKDENLTTTETKVSDEKQKTQNNFELLSNNFKEHSIILGELSDSHGDSHDNSHDNSDNSNNITETPNIPPKVPSGENNTQKPELPDNNGNTPSKPVLPDAGDGNQKPEQPDDKEEIPNPTPPLISIDTSNWKFEKVEAVYDGKEHVALVTGLPDYVTPVYTDNTRTNAGTTTARVSFEVPEGYAVPNSMETQIVISKATIEEIQLDKMWMRTDLVKGTITITPPSTIPKGVVCTYEVNGETSSSYVISDAGIYSVTANFDLTEDIKENYQLTNTSSKAVYQVTPEMWTTPEYDIFINELGTIDGQKKVEIWFQYNDSSFHASAVQWNIRYDYTRLELLSSTKGSSMTMGSQSPYSPASTGFGYAMGNFYTWATLQTLEFKVLDENATDIAINLTNIEAPSADDFQKYYTNGTGIVLNQQSNLINVTLPKAHNTKMSMQTNLLTSLLSNDTETDEIQEEDIVDEDANTEEIKEEEIANPETEVDKSDEEEKEDSKVEPDETQSEGITNTETEEDKSEKEEIEDSKLPETEDSKKEETTKPEAESDKPDEEKKEDDKVTIPEEPKKEEIADSGAEVDKSDAEEKEEGKVLETDTKKEGVTDTKTQESEKEIVEAQSKVQIKNKQKSHLVSI